MDRRQTPANDRVVAVHVARQFPDLLPVTPVSWYVGRPVADICRTPGGSRDRQMVYGEVFDVLEHRGGHAFGIASARDYVGWVEAAALAPHTARGTALHQVMTRQTHAYPEPDMKTRETQALPHRAQLCAQGTSGAFTRTELGWVPSAHLGTRFPTDPVTTAEAYLGTPYLWGGNSCWGIDCSGLVQNALWHGPGDSDLQEAALGETLPPGTPHERGDLLFWKGHVAWVSAPDTLLHANAHHMAVTHEPIAAAIARISAQGGGPVTRHARLR